MAQNPRKYVALGDSYTSAPLVPPLSPTAPLGCLQSASNYPHLLAQTFGLALSDVSCAGADVSDMTKSQLSGQPPQFKALTSSTSVVTIGIGGNDNSLFTSAALGCIETDALDIFNIGSPCEARYGSQFANEIAADAGNIGTALRQIHTRAPSAKLFVVGYPDVLPQSGNCYPQMPVTTGDIAYLNGIEQDLNSMLAKEAGLHRARFVNTFRPSIGHDSCQPESIRWIEPLIPGSSAAPAHPNKAGEAADARDVGAAFTAAGI